MFSKILVAIDDSAMNRPVFQTALFLAQATKAELRLVYVVDPDRGGTQKSRLYTSDLQPYSSGTDESNLSCYLGHLDLSDQAPFKKFTSEAEAAGIRTNFVSCFGIAGSTICEVAYHWNADLIVIGRRGLSELTEQHLGSVSAYVMRHAPCAVHVVPRPFHINLELPSIEQGRQVVR